MEQILKGLYVLWCRARKFWGLNVKISHYGRCSQCGTKLDGGPIPEKDRDCYSPPYRWSRVIGIELPHDHPEHYDGISFWQCPDCQFVWPRFTKSVR